MTVHNFEKSLAWSQAQSSNEIWEKVYRAAFPTFLGMHRIDGPGWGQLAGIDRVVILKSSKQILVDEKVRSKDYDDILLEIWSDRDRRIPGWVAKDLCCDFIAYAFLPSRRCFLLPFQSLRLAYKNNGKDWKGFFGTVKADNSRYFTESIPVPISVLMDAIRDAMAVSWEL